MNNSNTLANITRRVIWWRQKYPLNNSLQNCHLGPGKSLVLLSKILLSKILFYGSADSSPLNEIGDNYLPNDNF